MRNGLRYFGLAVSAISSMAAQHTTAPTLGGANSGISTGSIPSQPSQTSLPGQNPQNQMPVFLSGRVMLDDGTSPENSISIQRTCSGAPRTVAYTNGKGQFSFQWGSMAGIVPDASEATSGNGMRSGNGIGNNEMGGQMNASSLAMGSGPPMMGCELTASAPGFRSGHLDLSSHRPSDSPDVGTIVLHRIAGVEGTSISVTSLNAPKEARKAWEKGVQLLHKAKAADAEKELEKAVEIYPKYASAWVDLGRARLQLNAGDPARAAFLKAVDADGKLVEPYVELGEMAFRQHGWPDAARYLDRALQLDPVDYPRLWFEDAVADYNVQNLDRAEKNAREALKLPVASRDPRASQLLGIILMDRKDYAGADEALREYVKLLPDAKDLDHVKEQIREIDSHLTPKQP
jgi:tetratricopeptide (TPR) repeat protein